MSVLITTSLGDFVIDLYFDKVPLICLNFLKLCKVKYYNNCLFYQIQKDYLIETGDPTNTGTGGETIFHFIDPAKPKFLKDQIKKNLKHNKKGLISTSNLGPDKNNSRFFITLTDNHLTQFDGHHSIFGEVAEGFEVLLKMNEVYLDKNNKPLQNIRIIHASILTDPFEDPPGLEIPDKSPTGKVYEEIGNMKLDDRVSLNEIYKEKDEEEIKKEIEKHEANVREEVLKMTGDIPDDPDVKPPENVLFVCKLNPITQDEDIQIIFSKYGPIRSCQIVKDYKTGDSLQYAFIEYEKEEDCIEAFFKMNNSLIDERRIKVDFSQSVAKLWSCYRRKQYAEIAKQIAQMETKYKSEEEKPDNQPNIEIKPAHPISDEKYNLILENTNDEKKNNVIDKKENKLENGKEYSKPKSSHHKENRESSHHKNHSTHEKGDNNFSKNKRHNDYKRKQYSVESDKDSSNRFEQSKFKPKRKEEGKMRRERSRHYNDTKKNKSVSRSRSRNRSVSRSISNKRRKRSRSRSKSSSRGHFNYHKRK